MAPWKVTKKRRRIVIAIVLLIIGGFLFFGESQFFQKFKNTDLPFFQWIEEELDNILDFPRSKDVLTTHLENPKASVHIIDVGQGESILIRTGSGDVLIDGGESTEGGKVVEYLRSVGVSHLELIIATHPHSDHIGGLPEVFENISVGQVLLPEIPEQLIPTTYTFTNFLETIFQENIQLVSAIKNATYTFGQDVKLTILGPDDGAPDLNNLSTVLRLDVENISFIFTGDGEKWSEEQLLKHPGALQANVLNIGHHGSNTSTSNEFLKAVKPSIALISCGIDNSYGHPHENVMTSLIESEIDIYRTDLDGTIVVETDGKQIAVVTEYREVKLVA